jgi:hypothetical protein
MFEDYGLDDVRYIFTLVGGSLQGLVDLLPFDHLIRGVISLE